MSYVVRVFDINGNEISSQVNNMNANDDGELNIYLKQKIESNFTEIESNFTEFEVMLLLDLIHHKLHEGAGIDLARDYVNLYDKIKKIGNKK